MLFFFPLSIQTTPKNPQEEISSPFLESHRCVSAGGMLCRPCVQPALSQELRAGLPDCSITAAHFGCQRKSCLWQDCTSRLIKIFHMRTGNSVDKPCLTVTSLKEQNNLFAVWAFHAASEVLSLFLPSGTPVIQKCNI